MTPTPSPNPNGAPRMPELRKGPYNPPWRVRVAARPAEAPAKPLKRWRDLWPLPTFLFGVFSLLLVLFLMPKRPPSSAEAVAQAIAAARKALEEEKPAEALRHARRGWEQVDAAPAQAEALRFLLGSAYLLGGANVEPGLDAPTAYTRARADLEAAAPAKLPEEWRPLRAYRLALAAERTGAPAEALEPLWEEVARGHPAGRVEAYAKLAALHLAKEPPALEAALACYDRLLMLPDVKEPNPFRLRRGELLLKLGRRDEARQTLARIPSGAKEAAAARHLHAQSYFEEEAWGEALKLWEQELAQASPATAARPRFFVGLCCLKLDQPELAYTHWRPLLESATAAPERDAALFRWAEAKAMAGAGAASLALLRTALEGLALAREPNPYLDRAAVRRGLEQILAGLQMAHQHEAAIEIIEQLGPWAEPGEQELRLAEAHESAGRRALTEADRDGGPGERQATEKARAHFAQAAAAFKRLADLQMPAPSDASWPWRAAENWLRAGDAGVAAPLLEAELKRPLSSIRRTETLVALGEALQALGRNEEAIARLTEALRQPTAFASRAQYLIAVAHIDRKAYREAEAALRSLAGTKAVAPEPREAKQARFALGYVLYWQGRFAEAAKALETAAHQHPDEPQSWTARYWWAEAHRQAGLQQGRSAAESKTDSARSYYLKQQQEEFAQALELFRKLSANLQPKLESLPPGAAERTLERDARFGAGLSLLELQRPAEALPLFEALMLECGGQPEELTALMGQARGQIMLSRKAEARQALARLRGRLAEQPEEAFAPPRMSKTQWLEWLGAADRSVQEGN